jgi:hypothetical protein
MNGLLIKAHKSSEQRHDIYIFTDDGNFVANGSMKEHDGKYLEVDSTVARSGFGKYLYDFITMYAHEQNMKAMSTMDGSTREAAMKHWHRMLNDSSFEKEELSEDFRYQIDFTTKEDEPVFFSAFSKKPNDVYMKYKKSNETPEDFIIFSKLKNKYEDLFYRSYELDCNKWIDDEYPISTFQLHKIINNEKNNKAHIKNKF